MDELTIAWNYAHLWLHIFGKPVARMSCPMCDVTSRTAKPRYVKGLGR